MEFNAIDRLTIINPSKTKGARERWEYSQTRAIPLIPSGTVLPIKKAETTSFSFTPFLKVRKKAKRNLYYLFSKHLQQHIHQYIIEQHFATVIQSNFYISVWTSFSNRFNEKKKDEKLQQSREREGVITQQMTKHLWLEEHNV